MRSPSRFERGLTGVELAAAQGRRRPMGAQERLQVIERGRHVGRRRGVVTLDRDEDSVLSSRAALALDCRQHQRRALTASASSAKMTSPGSGWAVSLAPRSDHGSSPRAKRTVRPQDTARRSKTATGSA